MLLKQSLITFIQWFLPEEPDSGQAEGKTDDKSNQRSRRSAQRESKSAICSVPQDDIADSVQHGCAGSADDLWLVC
jgi:hypothetical protein